jgi:polysaccharide export outer membrane protein
MKQNYIYYVLCIILLSGCAKRNLVYFSDLDTKNEVTSKITNDGIPKILENDILSISVNSTSPESNLLFASSSNNINANGMYEREGYRVSKGSIKFPVLGNIKLEGLTIVQAQNLIEHELNRYVTNSVVNVKFLNFRVTVIGEVNHPSTFVVQNERLNLLEALGLAGDMTPYGKRENVLIIREVEGKRTMARLNLNNQNVLNSPYFHMKQNDVIYIEPHKTKSIEYSNSPQTMPLVIAVISAVAVLATAILQ